MKNSFSFLAKHISWKYIVLILILFILSSFTVPYLPHKICIVEEYKEKYAATEYYSDIRDRAHRLHHDNNDALFVSARYDRRSRKIHHFIDL